MGQDNKDKLALAMQLLSRREYSQSEQMFKDLIASGSELAGSFYGMGMIGLNSGELDIATKQFENCVRLEPNHANAHYYLGYLAEKRQDAWGAKIYYDKVLQIDPKHAGALKKVGVPGHSDKAPPPVGTPPKPAMVPGAPPMQSDFYALLRGSAEPVEQEISRHLDAIAALIGERRAQFRAIFGYGNRFGCFLGWLLGVAGAILILLHLPAALAPRSQYYRVQSQQDASVLFVLFGVLLSLLFLILSVCFPLIVSLRAKNSQIKCERDWLLLTEGALSKSTKNIHLFILSRGEVSVHQSFYNRRKGYGTLELTGLSLRGYFKKSELDQLSTHFRQLSLLNPTGRNILAALGELKQIRSGAN